MLQPHATLVSDLLTPKVDRFVPLSCGPFVPSGIKISSFIHDEGR